MNGEDKKEIIKAKNKTWVWNYDEISRYIGSANSKETKSVIKALRTPASNWYCTFYQPRTMEIPTIKFL